MKNLLMPHRAEITGVKIEAPDVKTYTLKMDGTVSAFPGLPGQFNMVGYPGVGEAPISFSSISSGEFRHTIRAVGRVTDYLKKFKEGGEIFLRGPYGNGWPMEEARGKHILLIAGGLGLAPIRPVIESVIAHREAFGDVTLVYGAREPEAVIFKEDLTDWRKHISVMLTVDEVPIGAEWGHDKGIITWQLEKITLKPERTVVFICGPELMMRFAARRMLLMGAIPSKVYVSLERRMKCGVAQCGHCQHGSGFVCKDGPVFLYRDVYKFPDGML